MLKQLLAKSWVTTLVGVLLIAGAVGHGVQCTLTGGDFFTCIQESWAQILAAVGFIGAKDALASDK